MPFLGAIGWMIPGNIYLKVIQLECLYFFACIPVIIFYIKTLLKKANNEDKRPLGALLAILLKECFWAVFKQNRTALTRWWANYYTKIVKWQEQQKSIIINLFG